MWVESHSQEVAVLSPVGTGSGDGDGIQLRIRKRHEPPWTGTSGFIEFFVIGGVQAGVDFSISRGSEGFLCGSAGKESVCNVGDVGSIPRLGRSPGEGKSYPLQSSGWEDAMDCTVHGVAKSQTQLSSFQVRLLSSDMPVNSSGIY